MADFPGLDARQSDLIMVGTPQLLPEMPGLNAFNRTTTAWPTANLGIFVPWEVSIPFLATQMMVVNGATVSGNIDVGIYTAQGTRVVAAGSTAQAGTSAAQTFNITDTLINPGRYYLAVALDNTTGIIDNVGLPILTSRVLGVLQAASAFSGGLAATVTFAAVANAYVPEVHVTSGPVL